MLNKINNFKKLKVKNFILSSSYSPKGQSVVIKNGDLGIDVTVQKINEIKKLIKEEPVRSFSSAHKSFSDALNIDDSMCVRWDLLLDSHSYRSYLKYLKQELEHSSQLFTSYYTDVFVPRCNAYVNLNPVKYESKLLELPIYNHASLTGRTSITSGTNFMTMAKTKRAKLKSSKDDEVLVEIDVKSCEPSLYLKLINRYDDTSPDVYSSIKNALNLKDIPREKFKRGILSILYGANERTSKNILKCSSSDVEKIRDYFMIDQMANMLNQQYEEHGYLYNYYGRPIASNANPVNYWIQSSAVDYCSLGFSNLINNLDLKPCFFVHDSVTVSASKDKLNEINNIKEIYEPISGVAINVEIKILSE